MYPAAHRRWLGSPRHYRVTAARPPLIDDEHRNEDAGNRLRGSHHGGPAWRRQEPLLAPLGSSAMCTSASLAISSSGAMATAIRCFPRRRPVSGGVPCRLGWRCSWRAIRIQRALARVPFRSFIALTRTRASRFGRAVLARAETCIIPCGFVKGRRPGPRSLSVLSLPLQEKKSRANRVPQERGHRSAGCG